MANTSRTKSTSLAGQVMERAKADYLALEQLWEPLHAKSERQRTEQERDKPETKTLEQALGLFTMTHIEDFESIPGLPFPEDVQRAVENYTRRQVNDKLLDAVYKQYWSSQSRGLATMLTGKRITARCLSPNGWDFPGLDGSHSTTQTGVFNSYNPHNPHGSYMNIQRKNDTRCFYFPLWKPEFVGAQVVDLTQAVELTIN